MTDINEPQISFYGGFCKEESDDNRVNCAFFEPVPYEIRARLPSHYPSCRHMYDEHTWQVRFNHVCSSKDAILHKKIAEAKETALFKELNEGIFINGAYYE